MADFGIFDEEPTVEKAAPKAEQSRQENFATKKSNHQVNDDDFEDTSENRYLIFNLREEQYATPLLGVREIIEPQEFKPLPNTMPFFLGVINLRGQIVGLIDLRLRFGLPAETHENMALIVFDTPSGPLAALVDHVTSVQTIEENNIERQPNVKSRIPSSYLIGIAKAGDRLVAVLDLQKILSTDELLNTRNAVGSAA